MPVQSRIWIVLCLCGCRDAAPEPKGAAPIASPPAPFVAERIDQEARAMGTHVALRAYTTPAVDANGVRAAFRAALGEIERLEGLMTTWREDSDVSKVNAKAGILPVVVSPETLEVVEKSIHTSEISEGTFDITFESLHGLWKFDEDLDPHPPSDADVKAKLSLVDFHRVKVDHAARTIFIDKAGTKIGLGGIAKGYAVDKAAAILLSRGLTSFFVQAGGDLYTHGNKADGTPWMAGVRDPRGPETQSIAIMPVVDHAFSTAGDYERSYLIGTKRYHHIIDPRTGQPATASRSVTIYAPTAFEADALDDAVFILGPQKGMKLVDSIKDCGAIIVDANSNLWISEWLRPRVQIVGVPTQAP